MNADKKVIARQLKAYFFYKQKPDGYVVGSDCRKTSFVDKKGVAGAKPPTGTRGGSPSNIAPSYGEGVWG